MLSEPWQHKITVSSLQMFVQTRVYTLCIMCDHSVSASVLTFILPRPTWDCLWKWKVVLKVNNRYILLCIKQKYINWGMSARSAEALIDLHAAHNVQCVACSPLLKGGGVGWFLSIVYQVLSPAVSKLNTCLESFHCHFVQISTSFTLCQSILLVVPQIMQNSSWIWVLCWSTLLCYMIARCQLSGKE
jgi:hypothetical protein